MCTQESYIVQMYKELNLFNLLRPLQHENVRKNSVKYHKITLTSSQGLTLRNVLLSKTSKNCTGTSTVLSSDKNEKHEYWQ